MILKLNLYTQQIQIKTCDGSQAVFTVVQWYWNKQALYVTALTVHAKFGILIVYSVTLFTKSGCLHMKRKNLSSVEW